MEEQRECPECHQLVNISGGGLAEGYTFFTNHTTDGTKDGPRCPKSGACAGRRDPDLIHYPTTSHEDPTR